MDKGVPQAQHQAMGMDGQCAHTRGVSQEGQVRAVRAMLGLLRGRHYM